MLLLSKTKGFPELRITAFNSITNQTDIKNTVSKN